MQPFISLDDIAVPLLEANINTDQLLPSRYLRKQRAEGFGQYLFRDLRYRDEVQEHTGFILNQTPYRAAKIIVASTNFGCGSSREMAVWAVADYGIRVLISSRFADIFYNNCFKNGLLPIVLPQDVIEALQQFLLRHPGGTLNVNLNDQQVKSEDGQCYSFEINPFNKKCLLQGIDAIDYTLQLVKKIEAYEQRTQ
jgi:3-isopropylmalate/(R)-2-methylmalate dehydratase small subunit